MKNGPYYFKLAVGAAIAVAVLDHWQGANALLGNAGGRINTLWTTAQGR